MPNLVLLAGIPGSGKSTWAEAFFDLKYAVVSSDAIRKELAGSLRTAHDEKIKPWDVFYDKIESCLTHSVDVIADATFLTPGHRQRARAVGERTGADVHLVLFKNWMTAIDRNKAREEDAQVPAKVMEGMMTLYFDTLSQLDQETYTTITRIEAFH